MNKRNEAILEIASTILVATVLLGPPLLLGTTTYPVAVVNGDSMYPVLKNGDIVIFSLKNVNVNDIPNGTIIAFVQTETGIPIFASLTAHPVTHEIINRIVNQNGQVYYQTKGVNNIYPDPQLLPAKNILGIEVKVIPYLGYVLIFFSQPGGMVALIGIIVAAYVSTLERKMIIERTRRSFIAKISNLVDAGGLSGSEFLEMQRTVEYPNESKPSTDPILEKLRTNSLKGTLTDVNMEISDGCIILKGKNFELGRPMHGGAMKDVNVNWHPEEHSDSRVSRRNGVSEAWDEPLFTIVRKEEIEKNILDKQYELLMKVNPNRGQTEKNEVYARMEISSGEELLYVIPPGGLDHEDLKWIRDMVSASRYENASILDVPKPEEAKGRPNGKRKRKGDMLQRGEEKRER